MAVIPGRRSIRSYEGRPLDDGTVRAIIDATSHALTAPGVPEGWQIVAPVISGYPKGAPEPQMRCEPVITRIG